MIVDAVEKVCEVGLWVEAVELGGFDQGHGTCLGFRAGIAPCKEPICPIPIGRIARSAALLSMATRPSGKRPA